MGTFGVRSPEPGVRPATPRRGAALLLVLFVLIALALLATPFLVAMVLQEKASRSYLSAAQARAGAVGARNFGVSQLLRTHEFRERNGGPVPFDDPGCDTYDEIFVPLDTRQVAASRGQTSVELVRFFPAGVADPKGTLWGLEVEDEQGKLHRRSAPDFVRTRLQAAVAAVAADPKRFFTDFASRCAPWGARQNVRAVDGNEIWLDDQSFYQQGSRVRLSDGTRHAEALVAAHPTGRGGLALGGNFGGVDLANAWCEVELRHSVNLNTARFETLQAVFEGLRWRGSPEEISRDEAARIAETLLKSPIAQRADWQRFLTDLQGFLTTSEVDAVVLNARAASHLVIRHTEQRQRPDPNNPGQMQTYEVWLEPRGTVPFQWHTENVYTLEASGTVNTPAGSVAAESRFREIVSVAPAERLVWAIETQADFEEYLHSSGFGQMGNNDNTRGFPFGHKVMTYPARTWYSTPAQRYGEPADDRGGAAAAVPGNPVRGLRPAPAKDRRGVAGGNLVRVNHFVDDQSGAEGRLLAGPYAEATAQLQPFQLQQNIVDLPSGGVEFWFKTTGGGDATLFDFAEQEYENRIACFLRGGELILRVCDATLTRQAAEVHARIAFEADTWYHLGAYWDSTHLGGGALFVDGRPVGTFGHWDYQGSQQGVPVIAELAQDLDPNATDVRIQNGGNFPPSGVIRIGREAIEYETFGGGTFRNCLRGARRTGPDPDNQPTVGWAHPAGVKVVVYGYANPLAQASITWGGQGTPPVVLDRIPTGRATLVQAFGADTRTQINKPARPLATPPDPGGITAADVTIPVLPGATQNFPKRGYIRINGEVIFYNDTTPVAFAACQRGQLGTQAAAHGDRANVSLFGFEVSNNADYPNPGLIQIDDEWFAPVQPVGANYFTGLVVNGAPVGLQRGVVATGTQAHGAGAKVIPVFAVRDPSCGAETLSYPTGRDTVTLVDRSGAKEEHRLRVVRLQRPTANWNWNLVGLDDWVNREWVVDGAYTRLLKWPSGELPSKTQPDFTINGAQVAGGAGAGGFTLDELRYWTNGNDANRGAGVLAQPVAAGADAMTVTNPNWAGRAPANGGLVMLGDEVIAYRERNGQALERCARAFFGTPAAVHDMGERLFFIGAVPVGVLAAPCAAGGTTLNFTGSPNGFAGEGYALVDNEVVGYTWNRNNGGNRWLEMPKDRAGTGIFHGAFGTGAASHNVDAIVVGIPFRYWDRYRARTDDNQMVSFQAAKFARGAYWGQLDWQKETKGREAGDPNLDVLVQARFDGEPAWDTAPKNGPKGLFQFVNSGGGKLGVGADQIELRVLFAWRPGSYWPANSWKRAPTLLNLHVEYEQPTTTLHHEER